MSDASRLALIPAYFLSKYDRKGLVALGYSGFTAAFNDIGDRLGISPSSVKNKRDDFDPLHENARAGWYQRPLGPSRAKVVSLFAEVGFEAMTGLVSDILHSVEYRDSEEMAEIVASLKASESSGGNGVFVPRGATGRRAEALFCLIFSEGRLPLRGELVDRREDGCGYDFLVKGQAEEYQVEVKGLIGLQGGILLTDKEWQTLRSHSNYRIFVAYNLDVKPKWKLIRPLDFPLRPNRNVRTVVQISWHIDGAQLALE
jgi:hypothetical protein